MPLQVTNFLRSTIFSCKMRTGAATLQLSWEEEVRTSVYSSQLDAWHIRVINGLTLHGQSLTMSAPKPEGPLSHYRFLTSHWLPTALCGLSSDLLPQRPMFQFTEPNCIISKRTSDDHLCSLTPAWFLNAVYLISHLIKSCSLVLINLLFLQLFWEIQTPGVCLLPAFGQAKQPPWWATLLHNWKTGTHLSGGRSPSSPAAARSRDRVKKRGFSGSLFKWIVCAMTTHPRPPPPTPRQNVEGQLTCAPSRPSPLASGDLWSCMQCSPTLYGAYLWVQSPVLDFDPLEPWNSCGLYLLISCFYHRAWQREYSCSVCAWVNDNSAFIEHLLVCWALFKVFPGLISFLLTIIECYYHPHFTDKENEAQWVPCPDFYS